MSQSYDVHTRRPAPDRRWALGNRSDAANTASVCREARCSEPGDRALPQAVGRTRMITNRLPDDLQLRVVREASQRQIHSSPQAGWWSRPRRCANRQGNLKLNDRFELASSQPQERGQLRTTRMPTLSRTLRSVAFGSCPPRNPFGRSYV